MTSKQGEESTKILKDENDPMDNYIFQGNKNTKLGAVIVTVALFIILAGLILSGIIFKN